MRLIPSFVTLLSLTTFSAFAGTPTMEVSFDCNGSQVRVFGDYTYTEETEPSGKVTVTEGAEKRASKSAAFDSVVLGEQLLGKSISFELSDGTFGVLTTQDYGDENYSSTENHASLILANGGKKRVIPMSCGFNLHVKE